MKMNKRQQPPPKKNSSSMATVTAVDCQKQVRSWSLLRSVLRLLIPTCNCTNTMIDDDRCIKNYKRNGSSLKNTITGTIFGYRRGKVRFCIQTNADSTNPILLLELAVPTSILAKEMRGGRLRIVLESGNNNRDDDDDDDNDNDGSLLSRPLWTMYCNGRKVGYAVKRRPSNTDLQALSLMRSVVEGTGVMNCKELMNEEQDHQLMYLRANFQRVRASTHSESFHLIDPEGGIDQELSIFFFRST